MDLVFLGTGGAWGLPELDCPCLICREMQSRGERRSRTSLLLSGEKTLLIDCGPDASNQLSQHRVGRPDAVLITHEHGDHYMGLDELSSFKRAVPRGEFVPIPVFMTSKSWEVIKVRFGYLEETGVIKTHLIEPGMPFEVEGFKALSFKTDHGPFAKGSVGYLLETEDDQGRGWKLLYSSDFLGLAESPRAILEPDYLIIQSFWLHEPAENTANHMSLQKALDYIRLWKPQKATFLVHIGDGDLVPGDPANDILKKKGPGSPLRPPSGGDPYPVPLCQSDWQETADRIAADHHLPCALTVAYDGLSVRL